MGLLFLYIFKVKIRNNDDSRIVITSYEDYVNRDRQILFCDELKFQMWMVL